MFPPPFRLQPLAYSRSSVRAFSIFEFVGILGVIAIMAALAVPRVIKRIDSAAWTKESATVSAMADALTQRVLRTNNIPDESTWLTALSTDLNQPSFNIATNARNYRRAFIPDRSGWLGYTLPYDQNQNGTSGAPTNSRILIVSSLMGALPNSLFSYPSAAIFNDLWGTQQGSLPTNGIWSTYKGKADDLLIQRVNLERLFHRIILINNDIGSQPYFSIKVGANNVELPVPQGGSGQNAYYLDGTVLGLRDTSHSMQVQEIIRSDLSRVYERGIWRDEIGVGVNTNGSAGDFSVAAAAFFGAAAPPGSYSTWNPTPRGVAEALCAYMYGYAAWACEATCFDYHGNGSQNKVPEYKLISAALGCFDKSNGGGTIVP